MLSLTLEEEEHKEYLKSLFEILILMGKQSILWMGMRLLRSQKAALLQTTFRPYRSAAQQRQMLEICESRIREATLREVRDSRFFSVNVAGEEHLPVLVRFVDEAHNLREEFVGFQPCEADAEILAVKFHATITEKWGLNMEYCRAFEKNLQALTSDVCFAASSLTAVLHSLKEVMENIEVYHEFWFEEATDLATKLVIQMKLPGKFLRAWQGNLESQLTSASYYKDTCSVPMVEHIIQELKDIFSEQHLKALKCLSLVLLVMGQLKFKTSEELHADVYRSDLPDSDRLSVELPWWRIKWKHRGKDIEFPSTVYDTLLLPDIKFFSNVYALLKVLCILPVRKVENEHYENGRKRLKAYLRNTLTD
ncbi:hypothetical protein U0070_008179 [Myodes glareolus]|uniref:Uncharacterized protein n=1 Tax=Myodes glareolus TaxID=447135 RepID=A0AAW0HN73_MYOGA